MFPMNLAFFPEMILPLLLLKMAKLFVSSKPTTETT